MTIIVGTKTINWRKNNFERLCKDLKDRAEDDDAVKLVEGRVKVVWAQCVHTDHLNMKNVLAISFQLATKKNVKCT